MAQLSCGRMSLTDVEGGFAGFVCDLHLRDCRQIVRVVVTLQGLCCNANGAQGGRDVYNLHTTPMHSHQIHPVWIEGMKPM